MSTLTRAPELDPALSAQLFNPDRGQKPVATPRTYIGRRQGAERIVEVLAGDERARRLDPRHDLAMHSPDELEWASGRDAPLQLALAILADVTGSRRIALSYYMDFRREVIADLPWQEWWLEATEIFDWLTRKAIAELEQTLPPSRVRRRQRM